MDPELTGFPIGYAGDSGVHMYIIDKEDPSILVPNTPNNGPS